MAKDDGGPAFPGEPTRGSVPDGRLNATLTHRWNDPTGLLRGGGNASGCWHTMAQLHMVI